MAGQAILVRSSSKATSLRDFTGKKLIIVFDSTSEKNLRSNVPECRVGIASAFPTLWLTFHINALIF